jgi:hypothetical protein
MWPRCCRSPELYSRGTSPGEDRMCWAPRKCDAPSSVEANVVSSLSKTYYLVWASHLQIVCATNYDTSLY